MLSSFVVWKAFIFHAKVAMFMFVRLCRHTMLAANVVIAVSTHEEFDAIRSVQSTFGDGATSARPLRNRKEFVKQFVCPFALVHVGPASTTNSRCCAMAMPESKYRSVHSACFGTIWHLFLSHFLCQQNLCSDMSSDSSGCITCTPVP